MKSMSYMRTASSLIAGALLLAACGGGGGDGGSGGGGGGAGGGGSASTNPPPTAGTDVPLSATTSPAGAMAFMRTVANSSDDRADPLVVGDAVLATSDTDEPDPAI